MSPHRSRRLFALIIGINEYESLNVSNLLGAVPDADAMRNYLQQHLHIPSSQIRILLDSEATRAAIIAGIEAFSLNKEVEVGDPILIYYAGHGSSVDTPKGWEVGGTGKVELLIPYDHSSPLEDGNHKHGIPDRTLAALLSHLAMKKGDNITVILDCCHSGSGTRNYKDPTELVRGIDVVGNIPSDLDEHIWSSNGEERGTEVHSGFAHKGLRSHVLLAACGSEESAIEHNGRGLFTQKLLEALTISEIDKTTYAGLIRRMARLPSRQNPQCEGVNQNRIIFAKATSKSIVYYKIHEKGEGYVMADVGSARGIRLGAEFEVYKDEDSGQLLGIVVASKLRPFSTMLYAKEPKFALEGDGVACQTSAGSEEHVLRIYVADEGLKALVMNIEKNPSHRIIQPVEQHQAELGMALEDGKVVFDIFDPLVAKYGLTRMPFSLEPTLADITLVLHAADHFYWHLRRSPRVRSDTEEALSNVVEIEVAEMEHDGISYDDDFEPVLSPTEAGWKSGKGFDLQIEDRGTIYGWKIINNSDIALYPALFYFDNSDWSITSYYEPPTSRGIVDPPLKGQRHLPVGYGDSGTVPHIFFLREGQNLDVGILKLFLSTKQVDLSDVAKSSPFVPTGARLTRDEVKVPSKLRHHWDTILVPVVQRRADK